jgi:hypothetical protein
MAGGHGVLSTQVLQEFFVIATRKLGIDPEVARRKVELSSTRSPPIFSEAAHPTSRPRLDTCHTMATLMIGIRWKAQGHR